jgi:hypothetical protein
LKLDQDPSECLNLEIEMTRPQTLAANLPMMKREPKEQSHMRKKAKAKKATKQAAHKKSIECRGLKVNCKQVMG